MINNMREAEKIESVHRRMEREGRRMAMSSNNSDAPPASMFSRPQKKGASSRHEKKGPKKVSKTRRVFPQTESDEEMSLAATIAERRRGPVDKRAKPTERQEKSSSKNAKKVSENAAGTKKERGCSVAEKPPAEGKQASIFSNWFKPRPQEQSSSLRIQVVRAEQRRRSPTPPSMTKSEVPSPDEQSERDEPSESAFAHMFEDPLHSESPIRESRDSGFQANSNDQRHHELSPGTLSRFDSGRWFNDLIIDSYRNLLNQQGASRKTFIVSPLYYTTLKAHVRDRDA